ncbi:MAG: nicotinate-nucleotide adenylyltransferase [Eubacteriales bacterium]|nr:nicotinate-nucleotide adenylyltransferase [Eubacteriales bacterium]
MSAERKRIGIMGGTFDPIHIGHLILGEKAYEQLDLDEVWFLPAGNPPHKRNRRGRASDQERSDMVHLAIQDNPHFRLSLEEMKEDGYTYTCRTLENLKKRDPHVDYYFIIGADSLYSFESWRHPERICAACSLVVAVRGHTSRERLEQEMERLSKRYNGHFLRLDTPVMDVSSHLLRRWRREGKSLRYYVPRQVIDYMDDHGIYLDKERE